MSAPSAPADVRDTAAGAGSAALPICKAPVFLIGSPRSGTAALAQSLARRGGLRVAGESEVLYSLFAHGFAERSYDRAMEVPGRRWLRQERVSREEFLAYLGLGVNALITARSQGRRWIDHTPRHALIAETLAELFPGARFVHLLRDGRSVAGSMLAAGDCASDAAGFRDACETWREHVEAAMAFCEQREARAMVVRYEDVFARPLRILPALHRFLGLRDDVGPASARRGPALARTGQDPVPAKPEELWASWDEKRRRVFTEVAGPTMVRCGYWSHGEPRMAPRGTTRPGQPRGLIPEPEYLRLIADVRRAVESTTPRDSLLLVVARGDDRLLAFTDRRAWHFPRADDGTYAGHYPADSTEAIAHLEALRAEGATHLVLPETAFWWLESYEGLRDHLRARYELARWGRPALVYDLRAEHR